MVTKSSEDKQSRHQMITFSEEKKNSSPILLKCPGFSLQSLLKCPGLQQLKHLPLLGLNLFNMFFRNIFLLSIEIIRFNKVIAVFFMALDRKSVV